MIFVDLIKHESTYMYTVMKLNANFFPRVIMVWGVLSKRYIGAIYYICVNKKNIDLLCTVNDTKPWYKLDWSKWIHKWKQFGPSVRDQIAKHLRKPLRWKNQVFLDKKNELMLKCLSLNMQAKWLFLIEKWFQWVSAPNI